MYIYICLSSYLKLFVTVIESFEITQFLVIIATTYLALHGRKIQGEILNQGE
jgi:hypothetical protein